MTPFFTKYMPFLLSAHGSPSFSDKRTFYKKFAFNKKRSTFSPVQPLFSFSSCTQNSLLCPFSPHTKASFLQHTPPPYLTFSNNKLPTSFPFSSLIPSAILLLFSFFLYKMHTFFSPFPFGMHWIRQHLLDVCASNRICLPLSSSSSSLLFTSQKKALILAGACAY